MNKDLLKDAIERAEANGHGDDPGWLALTVTGKAVRWPIIRPEILAYGDDGTRVYGLTLDQCRRLLAAWPA